MQNIIIGVILMITCITITLLYLNISQIKKLTEKLKYINTRNTNEILTVFFSNKVLENITKEINNSIYLRKKAEGEYKELDLEIRQSIANISHDLRTPLTSIMGYIQLMEDEHTGEEEKKQYLGIIKSRSQVLKNLINSFYDLSRLQAKEYDFNMEMVNIADLLSELIMSFYDDFNNKNLEPVIDIQEKVPLVYADKSAVNRIFTNLVQNILKHAKRNLRISCKEENGYVVTEFINEAKELSKEDANKIFQRFFTGDRMRTGQNTGLGLAITKSLIDSQGHEISAEKIEDNLVIQIIWKGL